MGMSGVDNNLVKPMVMVEMMHLHMIGGMLMGHGWVSPVRHPDYITTYYIQEDISMYLTQDSYKAIP